MTRLFQVRVGIRLVLAAGLCGLISCQPPGANNSGAATQAATPATPHHEESRLTSGPVRDLSQDERAGGHILRKHVGQTEEDLRRRLQREENITGASTYTDRSTAEHVVGAAIAQSEDRIQSWLNRQGRHPNLVLDYDGDEAIGRTMNRGEVHSRPCTHALVVLKYAGPNNYYVLTSYPECR
ncbi:MAG: RNase A-like domain-containing protein [Terriglobales bacterium]